MTQKDHRTVTFAAWLESQIRRRGWNQSEFARRAQVQPGVVSHWTRGERIPSPKSVIKIADALDLDPDDVSVIVGHRPPDLHVDPDSATAQLMPLIEKIDWDTDPGRLEGVRMILEGYLEVDRRRKAGKK